MANLGDIVVCPEFRTCNVITCPHRNIHHAYDVCIIPNATCNNTTCQNIEKEEAKWQKRDADTIDK